MWLIVSFVDSVDLPWVGLQLMIVTFPGHTHLNLKMKKHKILDFIFETA